VVASAHATSLLWVRQDVADSDEMGIAASILTLVTWALGPSAISVCIGDVESPAWPP
jgi:hypothetical protein